MCYSIFTAWYRNNRISTNWFQWPLWALLWTFLGDCIIFIEVKVGIYSCYIHFGIYKLYIPIDSWISHKCLSSTILLISWMFSPCISSSMSLRAVTFLQAHPSAFYQNTGRVTALSLFQLRILALMNCCLISALKKQFSFGNCQIYPVKHCLFLLLKLMLWIPSCIKCISVQ